MSTPFHVNGLPLPAALLEAMENGSWRTPDNREVWCSLVPQTEVGRPKLYSLKMIVSENASWRTESYSYYIGQPDAEQSPGDLDPALSLLIADLGPDRPFALDYRESMTQPSVVRLTGHVDTRWIRVTPDIETFIRLVCSR